LLSRQSRLTLANEMTEEEIRQYVTGSFPDAEVFVASAESEAPEISWGDTFFFHDKESTGRPNRFPFATIVTKDYGDFDNASNLNRPGVFRLNLGLSRDTFRLLFGTAIVPSDYDFTALNKLMPHPVYAPQFFACILNPSDTIFTESIQPLLAEAYAVAQKRSSHG
jgi:uncharacterized protein DUF6194